MEPIKIGRTPFPKVRDAREALKERAIEILETYLAIIGEARAKGNFEVAAEHTRWLIEHMPAEDLLRMIDPSAAKVKEVSGPAAPTIQIGIALGGVKAPKALPSVNVIDVKPLKPDES